MSNHSRSLPKDHPVTAELLDTGLILKRSIELSETMMETWVSVLVSKVTNDHVIPFPERMQ